MNKVLRFSFSLILIMFFAGQFSFAQTQRNPVLEFCTGTWCQWCPCGDDMVENSILPAIPNAIILAYHGAGSDPFRVFPGQEIIPYLGLSAYPTGVIDRVTGIQNWNSGWVPNMNNRNNVPATVSIDVERSYNQSTREFTADVHLTALQNLNGEYKFNVILVEDGQVYGQTSNNTCSPGITYFPDYVHYWLVRDMMNGALGEVVINGAWNQGQEITKNVNHTFTLPTPPAPDFVPDSCAIVVLVYKNGSPLNSNAEIQQAELLPLISPDFLIELTSSSNDLIIQNNEMGEFSTVINNIGAMDDSYYIDVNMTAPPGWTGEFTTPTGTHQFGQQDLVAVQAGDQLVVDLSVFPNVINGFGEITIQFTSMNDPNINVEATLRLVTITGVTGLIIDASGEGYGDMVLGAMDQEFNYPYGIVSKEALYPSVDLTNFSLICWSSGNALPVFEQYEVDAIEPVLDNGGRLFINGQDIGEDIFDANGQSQFAQSFYNNYLHANYISSWGLSYFFNGLAGDPIGDGLSFPLADIYPRDPDEFGPYDASSTSILKFGTLTKYNSVRADDGNSRVVYLGFGLEQIADQSIRDTIIARSLRWLLVGFSPTNVDDNIKNASSFNLKQNYPNPFNPSTTISYSLGDESDVSLKVYDIMGREVTELVNTKQPAGSYEVQFDASTLASGMYFYKLTAGNYITVKKMTLLK